MPITTFSAEAANVWTDITSGASQFVTGVLTPVTSIVTTNPIALAFLSVTFIKLGVIIFRRVIGALGRGR